MSGFFGRQRDTGGNGKKDLPGDKLAKPHRFLYLSVTRLCVGAVLSQMPSRDICQRGTSTRIQCQADRQLALMFWYQQLPGQSLTLIATAN